tara:strand:+ start:241 stop:630 length:390 start_codon:yes stop_codon:yes gene_type:complete
MNKTEQQAFDNALLMAKTAETERDEANNRANKLQGKIDAKEVTLPFEVIAERIDKTNKFLLAIPSLNFSAQLLLRRDNNTLIASKEYVHSEEETNSNVAIRELFERKARYDVKATQKPVASEGDVPSAS